jgi:DNA-binding phage protein
MHDRLSDIKASCHARVYGPAASDVSWLIAEVERLQDQIESIRAYLSEALVGHHSSNILTLLDSVLHQRRGAMTELAEIHDILAEALGYEKAPTLGEDPQCPCPGAWVTGDHTAASLALKAAKALKDHGETIVALGRSVDRWRDRNTHLEQYLQQRMGTTDIDTATKQIIELQRELAESRGTKKEELRREIAALRLQCCCVFRKDGEEGDRLLPHPDCPTHGIEETDRKHAGEKAIATLKYVRKYFMGSEHGHEV